MVGVDVTKSNWEAIEKREDSAIKTIKKKKPKWKKKKKKEKKTKEEEEKKKEEVKDGRWRRTTTRNTLRD